MKQSKPKVMLFTEKKSSLKREVVNGNNFIYGRMVEDMYIPNISGFVDFCSYHANGKPIYFVNGRLYAGFDMLAMIECRYNFLFPESKMETEKAIMENMYMFDVEETDKFYYPNDNMFSGDNSMRRIRGQILTLKEKYR